MTTEQCETNAWETFALNHEMWRFLLPSIQPELRATWLTSLRPLFDALCTEGSDAKRSRFLKEKVKNIIAHGTLDSQTALFLLALMLFEDVVDHAAPADDLLVRKWVDHTVPACIAEWVDAVNGDQLALFVAQCALRYRRACNDQQLQKIEDAAPRQLL